MTREILRIATEEQEEDDDAGEEVDTMKNKGKDGVDGEETSLTKDSPTVSSTLEMGFEWVEQLCGLTPTSRQGQLVYMLIMLLIPILPIFCLITQNVLSLNDIILKKVKGENFRIYNNNFYQLSMILTKYSFLNHENV